MSICYFQNYKVLYKNIIIFYYNYYNISLVRGVVVVFLFNLDRRKQKLMLQIFDDHGRNKTTIYTKIAIPDKQKFSCKLYSIYNLI